MRGSTTDNMISRREPRPLRAGASGRRAGFGVIEMIVAMVLLGTLAACLAPTLGGLHRRQRMLAEQARLQRVAGNVVESLQAALLARPTANLRDVEQELQTRYADFEVAVELEQGEQGEALQPRGARPLAAIRVLVSSRKPFPELRPVHLTTWSLPQGESP